MPGRTPPSVRVDRAAGVLVGLAAGDALGAGYEFGPPLSEVPEMRGGGPFGWEPGEWTDDTQMAICVAEATSTGRLDAEQVAERFLAWYRAGPRDVGNQTRAVLSSAGTPAAVADRAEAHFEKHPRGSAGNGSLMRTAPIALAHLGGDESLARSARMVSSLTHADPLAGDACVLWCVAIDRAVREGRLDGVHDGVSLLPGERQGFWRERIAEAESLPPSAFGHNGYVVTALQAAYSAVFHTPVPTATPCLHFQHALQRAVQIGYDTDTVAAIAGGLLGGRWGLTAIPAAWQMILHGWPGLRSADLARMAILSAQGGRGDDAGWPAASSLHSYYAERYGSTPVLVTLPEDAGVRLGNFAALGRLGSDAPDVVVSLCRTGPADLPPGAEAYQPMLMDQPGGEHNPNLDFLLRDLARQIVAWRSAGKTVLVHCVRAESRTPTVAAAYLAERLPTSGSDALRRVRRLLPGVHPNAGFTAALERLWP